jgi:hypothetical protein
LSLVDQRLKQVAQSIDIDGAIGPVIRALGGGGEEHHIEVWWEMAQCAWVCEVGSKVVDAGRQPGRGAS